MNALTVTALWRECRAVLEAAGIENAAAELDWLWQAAIGTDRHLLRPLDEVDADKAAALQSLAARRAAHEPVQYLLGSWPFLDLELQVAPGVLIPRQDTECVAERAIELGRELLAAGLLPAEGDGADSSPRCIDLCSGTGALALALAVHLRQPVAAVELSVDALPILRSNAAAVCAQHAAPPVQVFRADIFEFQKALAPGTVALLASNPPYLTGQEMTRLQPEVTFEPAMALDGGADGLRFYRHIASAYLPAMIPGGALVLEIGAAQKEQVCGLLAAAGWKDIAAGRDAAGHDRWVSARA